MDTSTMKYPFGRCGNCGEEFNSELRDEYHITHCPYCGTKIDDFWSATDSTEEHNRKDDIFCEDCGRRIYERHGPGGDWIDELAGVCSGPCERELCGDCGDWDDDGCCPKCHELDPCGHCGNSGENRNEEVCHGCGRKTEEKKGTKTGWWKVSFDLKLDGDEIRFDDLSENSQDHIIKCIQDGCFQGELVEEAGENEESEKSDDAER